MSARQPRLLLAGGSHADIPMIRAARALGYHVITSGNRAGDLGHVHADETHLADFSDREAITALARTLEVEAIVPSCNDFSALSCAWAAEALGLPGHDPYDVACTLHLKDLYRAFAIANGIPTPRASGCASVAEARVAAADLTYPLIVKPVDLTGGKGISVARTADELSGAVAKALGMTRAGRIVIEEFLDGSRHGFTCIIRRGQVVFHFQDDEHYFLNPYMVSGASAPALAPPDAAQKLCQVTARIARLLNLADGIVHIQYIQHAGEPVIIEICRRPPGDLYVDLVRHATGVDYPDLIVRGFCGLDLGGVHQAPVKRPVLRHCVMSRETGRLRGLVIDPAIEARVIESLLWWAPGQVIEDVLTFKLGILFIAFEDEAQLRQLAPQMQDLVRPQVEA